MDVVRKARLLAEGVLSHLPSRLEHVRAVAAMTSEFSARLDLGSENILAAAWVHDVGYGNLPLSTGFHSLDGARYLRSLSFPSEVVCLVAHHTYAQVEADLRGLHHELLTEFREPDSRLSLVLSAADMSVGPSGVQMSIDERLRDIRRRYGPQDVVRRFIDLAEPDLRESVSEVQRWLAQSQ